MTGIVIILAAGTMLVLAVFMAYVLGWANQAFHVEIDPRVEKAIDILPGANCGGCGLIGCSEFAEAVVKGDAPVSGCPVGGPACAEALAGLLGVELDETAPYRPIVHCGAHYEDRLKRTDYVGGEATCAGANLVGGVQGCTYGCLGFGECVGACKYDAVHVVDGLATVDYVACIGCGACAKVCPRNIISMVPFKSERMPAIACSNKDFGKDVKAVCTVGCIGCKGCTRVSDLFVIGEGTNLPHIDYDRYDPAVHTDLNVVFDKCPMKRVMDFGKPTPEDLAALEGEEAPAIAEADFKTTVDETEWRG